MNVSSAVSQSHLYMYVYEPYTFYKFLANNSELLTVIANMH